MRAGTIFTSLSAAGLLALCRCSIVFSVNGLEDGGGTDAADNEASPVGTAVPQTPDGSVGDSAPSENVDAAALEAADDGPDDTQLASGDGTGTMDAPGNAGDVDASSSAGFDAGPLDATIGPGVLDATVDSPDEVDANVDSPGNAGPPDAAVGTGDSGAPDAGEDGAVFDPEGLVAYYRFDESSGDTSADSSGNMHPAQMVGATFSPGLEGNAATMNGVQEYVALPAGIVSGLTSFSISAWFYLADPTVSTRIFDFGSDTTTYMFLTPQLMRFAITTSGFSGEQDLIGPQGIATGMWQHVVVTSSGGTGTLYLNGAVFIASPVTLTPASLGSTQSNWLGRSEYATDPYLNGKIDNFRIYSRALSAAEVGALFSMKQ